MREFAGFPKTYTKEEKDFLTNLIDEILKEKGYLPLDNGDGNLKGRTIGMNEFRRKYCSNHSPKWVRREIFYKFTPDWVVDVHPGRGKKYTIFEKQAAEWMDKHHDEINWKEGL